MKINRPKNLHKAIMIFGCFFSFIIVTMAGGRMVSAIMENSQEQKSVCPDEKWKGKASKTGHWQAIEKLIDEQKYEAASKEVLLLLEEVKKKKDTEEWTRCLIKATQLRIALHGYETAVAFLKEEEWPPDILSQTTLNLFYAFSLIHYYSMYSWEINQREKVETKGKIDLKAWTKDEIYNEAQLAYNQIWNQRKRLGSQNIGILAEYITPNNYPAHIRGTLRDAVSYLYVQLLSETTLWRPGHHNEIYLLNLEELIKDTESSSLTKPDIHPLTKACSILDDLRKWHKDSGRREAGFEAHLTKLKTLHPSFTNEANREIIKKNLEKELEKIKDKEWWAVGMAQLASFIKQEDTPDNLIRAHSIAEEGSKPYPHSLGAQMCISIMKSIEQADYQLTAMLSDGEDKNSIEIKHQNLSKLYFRAYPFNLLKEIKKAQDYNILPEWHNTRELFQDKKPLNEWEVSLPPTPDYKMHKTYLKPPIKNKGLYVIAASGKKDFSRNDNKILAVNFILTDLVIVTQKRSESILESIVFSGGSGLPISNVEVSLYQYDWKNKHHLVETQRTDSNGLVSFEYKKEREHYNFFIVARKDKDVSVDLKYFALSSPSLEGERVATLIYTDRSVYRPLQRVQWKVIAYKGKASQGDFKTMASAEVTVELCDPNNEVVETKLVTTNEFGSAAGDFNIPSGRLLGQWSIRTSPNGHANIQVEEYKRPTFEVKIKDPHLPLRLNKQASLSGEALYYFGLPVTSGNVKWRVTREPIYPCWWRYYCWHYPLPRTEIQTIATGITTLKEDGSFELTFTPSADERLSKKSKNITYRYSVNADVTDEGGETRSTGRSFRLGFICVEATIRSERQFFIEGEGVSLSIIRTNLDGLPRPGKGSWQLFRLKQPEKTLLPAEQPIIKLEDAQEPYQTEGDRLRPRWDTRYSPEEAMLNWKDDAKKQEGEAIHKETGEAKIHLSNIKAGAYRLYYETRDDFGEKFIISREIIVTGEDFRLHLPLILKAEPNSAQPGETTKILAYSGLPEQLFILNIWRAGKLVERRYINKTSTTTLIKIPITQKDRGGFGLSLLAVRDHQFIQLTDTVFVPWDNKELALEFSVFRDKLRPKEKETFKVKVKGKTKDLSPVKTVELLAYMYDRSLDFFVPHQPPHILSLYPSHAYSGFVHSNLEISHPWWFESDGFASCPSYPYLYGDSLEYYPSYGIGGPGHRGRRYFKGLKRKVSEFAEEEAGLMMDVCKENKSEAEPAKVMHVSAPGDKSKPEAEPALELRSRFEETAFFKPHLLLESDGFCSIEFTVPDSVTSWNIYVHAVTKDLKGGMVQKELKSVKDLMVRLYAPRFLREGDYAQVKVVVNNASDNEMNGKVIFDILDLETNQSIISDFGLQDSDLKKGFVVKAGGGANLVFPVMVPKKVRTIALKAVGLAQDLSDGEIRPLPILPARFHLIQSRFVTLKDKGSRTMIFKDLEKMDDPTLINEQIVATIDAQLFYTVLQALPYLVNYPYECTEQVLNHFISTGIVSSLYKKYPAIEKMTREFSKRQTQYEAWETMDPNQKMHLEETPWLEMARGGKETGDGLINVLDPQRAEAEKKSALAKLQKSQTSLGAFPWFPGGPPSPYMTLYILYGFSKALEFQVEVPKDIIVRAWEYMHRHYIEELVQRMIKDDCGWEFITFLNYTLSNYPDKSWYGEYFSEAERKQMLDFSFSHWKAHSPYLKGYLALTLKRMGRLKEAVLVFESVMDSAKNTEDEGTFWASEDRAWLWYNDTIETHAFAIRTLLELMPDYPKLDGLVQWIFLNKKLNHWKSTRATAETIYSLVHYLQKEAALGIREDATVTIGKQKTSFIFEPDKYTGKKNQVVIEGEKIDPATMSKIVVEKEGKGVLFASASWHFSTEKLPEAAEGDLFRITRQYFKRETTANNGFVLKPLKEGTAVSVGDQVEVQISIRLKHPAEYVHLRDPRAAGFEPETTVSKYKWDLGIGWYEEVRDSGQNFFFEQLPQGEYTFKYRIRANMAGSFKVAPATIQSMYAPEFNAYSEGAIMTIK